MKKALLILAALVAMASASQAQQVLFSSVTDQIPTSVSTTTSWIIPNTVTGAFIHDIQISWDSIASTAPVKLIFYHNLKGASTNWKKLYECTVGASSSTGESTQSLQWYGAYVPRADNGLTVIQDLTATSIARTTGQVAVTVRYR